MKYGIDCAEKDATEARYLVFLAGRGTLTLTAAFKEFHKKLSREQKPSIQQALAVFRDKAKLSMRTGRKSRTRKGD